MLVNVKDFVKNTSLVYGNCPIKKIYIRVKSHETLTCYVNITREELWSMLERNEEIKSLYVEMTRPTKSLFVEDLLVVETTNTEENFIEFLNL